MAVRGEEGSVCLLYWGNQFAQQQISPGGWMLLDWHLMKRQLDTEKGGAGRGVCQLMKTKSILIWKDLGGPLLSEEERLTPPPSGGRSY